MKIVIIGLAQGGSQAVQTLIDAGSNVEVAGFDAADLAQAIHWSATRSDDAETVFAMTPSALARHHVQLTGQAQAVQLDPDGHRVLIKSLTSGDTHWEQYDKLIFSPGSRALQLPIPGTDLQGILPAGHGLSMQQIQDYKAMIMNPEIQNVVIVGGGYVGFMSAESLIQVGKHITIIDHNSRLLAKYLDEELAQKLSDAMIDKGVDLVLNSEVTAFEGDGQRVNTVVADGQHVAADFVLMSAGTSPNTEWLQGVVPLTEDGYIKTDSRQQTQVADVYAIGDVTKTQYAATGKKISLALASVAHHQAKIAVHNLLGEQHLLGGSQGASGLKLAGYYFASTGINQYLADFWQVPVRSTFVTQSTLSTLGDEAAGVPVYFKLYYSPKTLEILGGQILSTADQTQQINTISLAIKLHATLRDLADTDFFFQADLTNYCNIIAVAADHALTENGVSQ